MFVSTGWAQLNYSQVVGSLGGSFSSGSMNADWTLGEVVISTLSTPSTIATQGFHQPMLKTQGTVIGISEGDFSHFNAHVYPNPVSQDFYLYGSAPIGKVSLELTNALGQVLLKRNTYSTANGFNEHMEIGGLASGIYMLKLYSSEANQTCVLRLMKVN